MKTTFALLISGVFLLNSCGKSNQQESLNTEVVDTLSDNTNQVLYNQVMDVHDEVMPKMDDIFKLKKALQEKITTTPNLEEEAKLELQSTINLLDSANNVMMAWMHEFKPDTLEGEELRSYLESQMEKIQVVKTTMLSAIEEAKAKQ